MATNYLPLDYQCTIVAFLKYLPITTGTDWQNQTLYFTLAKHRQNIDKSYNGLVMIGKSLV